MGLFHDKAAHTWSLKICYRKSCYGWCIQFTDQNYISASMGASQQGAPSIIAPLRVNLSNTVGFVKTLSSGTTQNHTGQCASWTIVCPHCNMDDETINHFIGHFPMWFNGEGRYFNLYYTSVSEIADSFPLEKIAGYICSTNHFNQHWLAETRTIHSTIWQIFDRGKQKAISALSHSCASQAPHPPTNREKY